MTTEAKKPERPQFEVMAFKAKEMFISQTGESKIWERELGFALQLLRGSTFLQDVVKTKAGADSITNAVVNLALIGTTLNPALAKAYLVPRKVHGTMLCCLDISYRGLAGIAMDSGSVKHLAPWLVYDFDHFDYRQEDGEVHIMHRPALNPPEDFIKNQPAAFWEHLVCGYMIATLHDGTKIISPPFAKWKLTKAMATSMTTSEKTPWRTHPDEMCLKTIIKHGYKLLPQTDRMSLAVSVLNEHEGLDLEAEKRARKKAGEDRFNEAEDAQWSEVGGEKVDTKTGEVKEEKPAKTGPDPCPSCKVDRKDGKCREKTCDLAIPSSEEVGELFGEKE